LGERPVGVRERVGAKRPQRVNRSDCQRPWRDHVVLDYVLVTTGGNGCSLTTSWNMSGRL
jgi:hypothetical protein